MGKKVLVLGGGISGLSLAWRLVEAGIDVEVVESENPGIGGLASTTKIGDYFLDQGPHFFLSENQELLNKVLGLFEEGMPSFKRSAQMYFHGRFINYPLTARSVLLQMGPKEALFCTTGYLRSKLREVFTGSKYLSQKEPNFEEWAISTFGDYLYKIFFKPYTEQFWKIPCHELSLDSIRTSTKMTLFKTLRLLLVKDIVKSNLSLVERETKLILYYPKRGIGEISERIAQRIKNGGGTVNAGWKVGQINITGDGRFVVCTSSEDGKTRDFQADSVISTIPLTDFVKMINPSVPSEVLNSVNHLGFLSLVVLYLVTDNRQLLDSSYLYHLDRPYKRIADMNKLCSSLCPPDENMLSVEFSCHSGDVIWNSSKEELFNMCIGDLERDGILKKGDVKKIFILKSPHAYPIYRYEYKSYLGRVLNYIEQIENLEVFGRTGRYMYMDMDQCMLKAFDFADKVITNIKG